MTNKEVWETLKKEFKGKSLGLGLCRYRSPEGNKCAVGCFIPDEIYKSEYEKKTYPSLVFEHPEVLQYMPSDDADVMHKFQRFHDEELDQSVRVEVQRAALFNEWVKLTK